MRAVIVDAWAKEGERRRLLVGYSTEGEGERERGRVGRCEAVVKLGSSPSSAV
jgi:hypothetical protein